MIETILKDHEIIIENVKHVFFNNCHTDKLFIIFAGKIPKYVSISWFYKNDQIFGNFLFLKNDEIINGELYYNSYNDEKYSKLIDYYIDKFNIKTIITYGPSMGGIASLYYGIKYNASLIVSIDPEPINYDYNMLIKHINEFNPDFSYNHKIFLNYTFVNDLNNIADYTKAIINALQFKNIIFTLHPYRSTVHLEFIPSKECLFNIIKTFEKLHITQYNYFDKWF